MRPSATAPSGDVNRPSSSKTETFSGRSCTPQARLLVKAPCNPAATPIASRPHIFSRLPSLSKSSIVADWRLRGWTRNANLMFSSPGLRKCQRAIRLGCQRRSQKPTVLTEEASGSTKQQFIEARLSKWAWFGPAMSLSRYTKIVSRKALAGC